MSEDILSMIKENVIQGRKTRDNEGIDESLSGTPGVLELTESALENNIPPELIITQALTAGMQVVGEKFSTKEYFIPDMLASADAVGAAMDILKPRLEASNIETKGRFVIATVKGDIHDIGKNIVTFMLDVNGFDVLDLGVDVPTEKFVEAIKDFEPQVVGLSGFLNLAYDAMKDTVEAIKNAGLRDKVKIMIGGGPMSDRNQEYAAADAYGQDAMVGVSLAKKWVGA